MNFVRYKCVANVDLYRHIITHIGYVQYNSEHVSDCKCCDYDSVNL